jgi:mono/diheme cytochrome c family protein
MKFLAGLIIGLIIIPLAGLVYFWTGSAPVATAAQAMPFEKQMAQMALKARVAKEAPKTAGLPASVANLLAGAQTYQQTCAVCHGLPGKEPTLISQGMFPRPPQLFKGAGVTDDPVGETYWKVANGIRLSGMPAFRKTLADQDLWQVSLLLANADKLPASAQAVLGQSSAH